MEVFPEGGAMGYVDWSMKGPSFGNCNCNWGCPCQFNAPPTDGTCRYVMVMRIEEGRFGDVGLDGLHWVGTYGWPGAIHEGNGAMQIIVDERADEAQREGLVKILHGEETEPGATVFQVYSTTVTTVHETLFKPIEFDFDLENRTARLAVPGLVESAGEPIRNPVTGKKQRVRVIKPEGFGWTEAEFGSGSTQATGTVKLDFQDSYAQFSIFHLTQSGPVR